MSIGITEFYKKMLPSKGVYCITTIEPKDGGKVANYYVESVDDLEPKIEELKSLNHNIYVTHSTFKGYARRKADAVYSSSLFVDLDVGEGKEYASKEEALKALDDFVIHTNLPAPTKLDSGRGIWGFWMFGENIPIDTWKVYAEKFKKFCIDNGLKVDVGVAADPARLTRTPNCFNYKTNPPSPTSVISDVLLQYNFAEFKEFLGEEDLSFADIIKAAKKGMSEEERMSQGGSNFENSFAKLLESSMNGYGCHQIKHMMEKPDDVSYELWTAGLTVASKCVDHETAIHTISQGAKDYNREATILKAATFQGVHPCTSFEAANPGGCEGCSRRGTATNPLVFASKLKDAKTIIPIVSSESAPEEEEEYDPDNYVEEKIGNVIFQDKENVLADPDEFNLPPRLFPYIRGPEGGIYKVLPATINKKTGEITTPEQPVLVTETDIWATKRLRNPSSPEGDCLEFKARFPNDPPITFLFPIKYAYSVEKTADLMGGKNILIKRNNIQLFMDYILEWGSYLTNKGSADVMRTHMGWTDDDKTSFVLGDREYKRDGTIGHSPHSLQTKPIAHLFKEEGSFEVWQKAAQNLNIPGLEIHAFVMLCGFASPIMCYSAVNGMAICLNGDAGSSKTGALYSALTMWCSPKVHISGLTKNNGATAVGIRNRINALHNMPCGIDEITNIKDEDLSDLVHYLSSGQNKVKGQSSVNAERAYEDPASLIAVITSNSSLYQKLKALKEDPNGEVARLLEFSISKPQAFIDDDTLGRRTFEVMKSNYGHAGPKFIQAIFDIEKKGELIRDYKDENQGFGPRFQKWYERFINDIGFDNADRFYHNAIAVAFGSGDVINEYGILNLDLERIYTEIVKAIKYIKKEVVQVNFVDVESLLTAYILKNSQGMLVIRDGKVAEEPKTALVLRSDDDNKTVYVQRKLFNTYLATEAKVQIDAFKKHLAKSDIEMEEKKIRLSKGWKDASSNEFVLWCYCFKKKAADGTT